MQRDPHDESSEDAAWRAIVDNYGDRPELEAERVAEPLDDEARAKDDAPPVEGPEWFTAPLVDPQERYVPPPPPPLPRPSRDRLVAWIGVFGSPAVLLVCLVARIALPSLLAYTLVAGFVGGFVYLVWQMPRGPRDPWDDGAQV